MVAEAVTGKAVRQGQGLAVAKWSAGAKGVGKTEIYRWENLVGPFLVYTLLGPRPPAPSTF